MKLTTTEREMLAELLRPRVHALLELHQTQIQCLPPGDSSWAETAEALERHTALLMKLQAHRTGAQ